MDISVEYKYKDYNDIENMAKCYIINYKL